MMFIKNSEQIKQMKEAGRITGEAIAIAGEMVREGVTTKQLDTNDPQPHRKMRRAVLRSSATAAFPEVPASAINAQVIHGIPSDKVILHGGRHREDRRGSLHRGFHGDSANTFPWAEISEEAATLIDSQRRKALSSVWLPPPQRARSIGDIGAAVDGYVTGFGYSTVQEVRRSRRGSRSSRGSERSELRTRRTAVRGSAAAWSSQSNRWSTSEPPMSVSLPTAGR